MKPQVTIVALGPGDPGLMTMHAVETLKHASALIMRTARHPASAWLTEQGIAFESLDSFYERYEEFDEMHAAMAKYVWQRASEQHVVFAVSDPVNDQAVAAIASAVPDDGKLICQPGVSRMDNCMAAAAGIGQAFASGVLTVPANACEQAGYHPSLPMLITELDNSALAGDVKLWLTDLYDDEMQVVFFPSTVEKSCAPKKILLCELDRQKRFDHTVAVLVPPAGLTDRQRYCFDDLIEVTATLRTEDEWDREQTHGSLRDFVVEEAWEVVAAIDEDDPDHLADELGDLLLQVMFHAHIGKAYGEFGINDITSAICRKMIHRHPHIFRQGKAPTTEIYHADWESMKMQERGLKTRTQILQDVPAVLPGLLQAVKVQWKAESTGLNWTTVYSMLDRLEEYAATQTKNGKEKKTDAEWLGDLLFALAAICSRAGYQPELLLHEATERFIKRFETMENKIISDGKTLQGLTTADLDVYWNGVKQMQRAGCSYSDGTASGVTG